MKKIQVFMQTKSAWWGILVALTLLGLLIRWYRLPDVLFFGFEQGRDALVVEQIAQFKDFVLVGPKTDIAGIFHGAWYYYILVIPVLLSGGNPVFSIAFLIFFSSLTAPIMCLLLREVTGRKKWGVVAGVLSVFSFELISYSRWLSNVTLAVPTMALCLWAVWRYRQTERQRYLVLALLAAALAAQFEIILCLWFGFFFGGLWLTRQIKWPSWKGWLVTGVGLGILFAPLAIFNLRNEFISFKSVANYTADKESGHLLLVPSLVGYLKMLSRLLQKSLFNLPLWGALIGLGILAYGNLVLPKKSSLRAASYIFTFWSLMSLPVIFFPHSLNLTQLYVGSALGLIGLATLALFHFSQTKSGKILLLFLSLLLIGSGIQSLYSLYTNQDVFFITIQDDLNLKDQRALLEYVAQDAAGNPYRLKAFTIPYYQEEGWQYLHRYYYPTQTELGAKVIYVVIERAVDPYWISKWIQDLGPTTLLEEKEFGLLRVQKRAIDQKE